MKNSFFIPLLSLLLISLYHNGYGQVQVTGELKKWHKITLLVEGPQTSEYARINPFLDYKLEVTFSQGKYAITVPGFYAADGNAAETSAAEGDKWAVHFRPNRTGQWRYSISFLSAKNIAVNEHMEKPVAVASDGNTGKFTVAESDKNAPDLRYGGRVFYDGGHYFKQANGNVFLKGGADSPENFLAYAGFDQTYRYQTNKNNRSGEANPKDLVHKYESHVKDWKEGDPVWQGGKGKGIIGALNYLASKGVNSQYMLTMNVLGDGKDVWPWADHNSRYRFDCSKLAQWEIVFDHMEKLGMMTHFVLQETENEVLLDGGRTATQRKLYLRELIARFGHHLAVVWNIGEENGPAHFSPVGQTEKMKRAMARYLKEANPYRNTVVLHTHSTNKLQDEYLLPLLGFEGLDGASLQIGNPKNIHKRVKKFVNASAKSGKKWVVCLDELGPAWKGIMPDADDAGHDTVRQHALWGAMMAGAAGVEWYFGYKYPHNDLGCENFRSRKQWWEQTKICLDFFRTYLPVENMVAADELVSARGAWCLADKGNVYVVYLPKGIKTTALDIENSGKKYSVRWYNPRAGGKLMKGSVKTVKGNGMVKLGHPPADYYLDWVVLIKQL